MPNILQNSSNGPGKTASFFITLVCYYTSSSAGGIRIILEVLVELVVGPDRTKQDGTGLF